MQKNVFISFLVIFLFLMLSPRAEAFVPETPHLLHLVVRKIKIPAGMVVYQTRRAGESASVPEQLSYLFPAGLRSEISTENSKAFYILSGDRFVRVADGWVAARERRAAEFYTDPMLFRDHAEMAARLAAAGIDTETVTFQRLEGKICFFVGQPAGGKEPAAGFWVEKDSFFPVRYKFNRNGRSVDIRYADWQRVSRTWYPMDVRIRVNGQPFQEIRASRFELRGGFSSSLFDVDRVLARYPAPGATDGQGGGHDPVDGLDKEIDDFSKMFDQ